MPTSKANNPSNPKKKVLIISTVGIFAGLLIAFLAISFAYAAHFKEEGVITNTPPAVPASQEPSTTEAPANTPQHSPPSAQSTPSSSASSTYRPFVCKNVPIPRQTTYRDNDAMAKGETRLAYQGQDGYYISCTADSTGYTPSTHGMRIEPINDTVDIGTGLNAQLEAQAEAERAARQQQYNINLVQCIQSLRAQGMPSSSAESKCRSVIRY